MKKIQVVISEKNYDRFQKVSKNKRSMLVDYALTRLFQSSDPTDVSIMSFVLDTIVEQKKDKSLEEGKSTVTQRDSFGGLTDED